MNKYNPQIHNRKSIRLKGYDYSQEGLYFITICLQDRACLLGNINEGVMHLNHAGQMVEKWYHELENKFSDIKCREMVVMPNHFHAIIEISVGANPRVCPETEEAKGIPEKETEEAKGLPEKETGEAKGIPEKETEEAKGLPEKETEEAKGLPEKETGEAKGLPLEETGKHVGLPQHAKLDLLPEVIQWFKTMTTNEYIRGVNQNNWIRFNGKLWQRNYWEHIIRNEESYFRISQYIINNPMKWEVDSLNS